MKKIFTLIISVLFVFAFNTLDVSAYSVISKDDDNGLVTSGLKYDSNTDSVMFTIKPNVINKIDQKMYGDSSYSDLLDSSIKNSDSSFTGAGARCAGYYSISGYSGSTKKFTVKFKINKGDTSATNCPEPTPDNPTDTGGNSQPINIVVQKVTSSTSVVVNCDISGVCTCIAKLEDSMNDGMDSIKKAINNSNKDVVDSVDRANDSITSAVDTVADTLKSTNKKLDIANDTLSLIDGDINDFHDEFVTDKDYNIKEIPDVLVDKPSQPTESFEDNTVYFTDQGDEEVPGRLPSVPDIKDWNGVTREDEKEKEKELKQEEFKQDSELSKSDMKKDDEMTRDSMSKDSELSKSDMKKDDEMTRDFMSKDDELSKSDMKVDDELAKDSMSRSEQYNQTYKYEKSPNLEIKD